MVEVDLKKVEARLRAHRDGGELADIHRETAAIIFNVSEDLVTPEQRQAGKAVNYASLYTEQGVK